MCCFPEQDLLTWTAVSTREWRNSILGYIRLSGYCSPRCLVVISAVSATVSSGANKRLQQGEKKTCCNSEGNGYWARKREETSYNVMWLHNRGTESGICFINLLPATYGYFKVNKILWKLFFCFVGILLLSLVFVHDIMAVYRFSG